MTDKPQETEYVLAQPTTTGPGAPVIVPGANVQTKQGHKCCGGCCDMRRAVIIVNIISLCFGLLGILSLTAVSQINVENYDDDEVKEAFAQGVDNLGVAIAITVVRVVLNICGIYGAVAFNIIFVGLSLVAYVIDFVMALLVISIPGLLLAGGFAYPHIFFIKEVKAGIMSKENYINEEQSCCCV